MHSCTLLHKFYNAMRLPEGIQQTYIHKYKLNNAPKLMFRFIYTSYNSHAKERYQLLYIWLLCDIGKRKIRKKKELSSSYQMAATESYHVDFLSCPHLCTLYLPCKGSPSQLQKFLMGSTHPCSHLHDSTL